jgi:hypothetical protein
MTTKKKRRQRFFLSSSLSLTHCAKAVDPITAFIQDENVPYSSLFSTFSSFRHRRFFACEREYVLLLLLDVRNSIFDINRYIEVAAIHVPYTYRV